MGKPDEMTIDELIENIRNPLVCTDNRHHRLIAEIERLRAENAHSQVGLDILLFASEHNLNLIRAERDRLAALVECATNFDADEKTIIVQINWEQKNVWIVERDEVDLKHTGWLCEGGQWISWMNGGSAHAAEKFPTREAAFSAYEAARTKEAAE